jgi:hypothetical protein
MWMDARVCKINDKIDAEEAIAMQSRHHGNITAATAATQQ